MTSFRSVAKRGVLQFPVDDERLNGSMDKFVAHLKYMKTKYEGKREAKRKSGAQGSPKHENWALENAYFEGVRCVPERSSDSPLQSEDGLDDNADNADGDRFSTPLKPLNLNNELGDTNHSSRETDDNTSDSNLDHDDDNDTSKDIEDDTEALAFLKSPKSAELLQRTKNATGQEIQEKARGYSSYKTIAEEPSEQSGKYKVSGKGKAKKNPTKIEKVLDGYKSVQTAVQDNTNTLAKGITDLQKTLNESAKDMALTNEALRKFLASFTPNDQ
eukprot:Nk52_evm28s32 gene=Nk52_evmTU28s32